MLSFRDMESDKETNGLQNLETLRIEGPDATGVLMVTLNRPEVRNAVNFVMHDELLRVAKALRLPSEVGAVLLTGEGESFCAGGDLNTFEQLATDDELRFRMLDDGIEIIESWLKIRPPVIAAVNGDAMGLGATLGLLSDIVYLADSARIADTHVVAGLVAGDGGALIWPTLLGPNRGKEFLMTGDPLSGEMAMQLGLVNHLVPAHALLDQARSMAVRLASGPRNAIAWTKQAVNAQLLERSAMLSRYTIALEAQTMAHPDLLEGMRAFQERRPPAWPSTQPTRDALDH
jgi:enoyl-CoA hydratase